MNFIRRRRTPAEFIKTYFYKQNCNRWILQKVKNIDYNTYAIVKAKLKQLRYNFLRDFGSIAGEYSPEDHKVGIYGKENLNQGIVLHETLHASSNNEYRFSPYSKNETTIGLMGRYNSFITDQIINGFVQVDFGNAINEAATEFFTYDIMKSKNKPYQMESVYDDIVNLFAIFCLREKDGKVAINENIKQKLFKFYIKSEFNNFVNYLSDTYATPKSQIKLLIYQFDKVLDLDNEPSLQFDMLVRCYNTIYEMQYNRFLARNKNGTLKDFFDSSEAKEIVNIIPENTSGKANLIAKELFENRIGNYKKESNDTNYLNEFILNNLFNKKINTYDIRANSHTDNLSLSNAYPYDKNYQNLIKELNDYEKLSLLLFYSSDKYLKAKNPEEIITKEKMAKKMINNVIDNAMPENQNQKNDFMFYLLNFPELKNRKFYKKFSPEQILDYVKKDLTRYIINKNNINSNKKLKKYLESAEDYNKVFVKEDLELKK